MPKSIFTIAVVVGVVFSGQWASAGNLPPWGGRATTQPQPIQQPRQPLISQPAAGNARTVQPARQMTSPRGQRNQPRTNTFRRTAPTAIIEAQQAEPVGTKTQWVQWCDLAWDAAKTAVNSFWTLQAHFQNVQIQAVSAICPVSCLNGPDIGPHIKSQLISNNVPAGIADIFATSIAGAWKEWQDSVNILGLPWYPSFAAYPGPRAPPTPNVPMPLIALSARQTDIKSSELLAARIFRQFRGTQITPEARDAINSFSKQFSSSFSIWLSSSMVQNVMGQGPVPAFAPPYVPVGSVVAGTVIPTPGVIIGTLR